MMSSGWYSSCVDASHLTGTLVVRRIPAQCGFQAHLAQFVEHHTGRNTTISWHVDSFHYALAYSSPINSLRTDKTFISWVIFFVYCTMLCCAKDSFLHDAWSGEYGYQHNRRRRCVHFRSSRGQQRSCRRLQQSVVQTSFWKELTLRVRDVSRLFAVLPLVDEQTTVSSAAKREGNKFEHELHKLKSTSWVNGVGAVGSGGCRPQMMLRTRFYQVQRPILSVQRAQHNCINPASKLDDSLCARYNNIWQTEFMVLLIPAHNRILIRLSYHRDTCEVTTSSTFNFKENNFSVTFQHVIQSQHESR